MHHIPPSILLLFILSGCASEYDARRSSKTAEFQVTSRNDSTSASVRNTYVAAFDDETCKPSRYGTRLGGKIHSGPEATTPVTAIAADEQFVFTAAYLEARGGETRSCHFTAGFVPLPSHRYRANIDSTNEARHCTLAVFDQTSGLDEPVEIFMPAKICRSDGGPSAPNGRSLRTLYKLEIVK